MRDSFEVRMKGALYRETNGEQMNKKLVVGLKVMGILQGEWGDKLKGGFENREVVGVRNYKIQIVVQEVE